MKRILARLTTFTVLTAVMIFAGCEWSGGGNSDFNTSGGAANINISGFYRGALGNGFAIMRKEGGAVTSFVIQQSGNTVQVTDSNGQVYTGSVGSPNVLIDGTSDSVGAGTSVSSFQISWAGTDGTAGVQIEFTGVISLVATQDTVAQTQVRIGNEGGAQNDEVDVLQSVQNRQYVFAEEDSQFRLQGTWVQASGGSSQVEAVAAGAGSLSFQFDVDENVPGNINVPIVGDTNTVTTVSLRISPDGPLTVPVNEFVSLTALGGSGVYTWSGIGVLTAQGATTTILTPISPTTIVITLNDGSSSDEITINVE